MRRLGRMLELVDGAAEDGRTVFWPSTEFDQAGWERIVELPASIGKLTEVTHLRLYGSHLVRIPPEIGDMRSLQDPDAYTSYGLRWFPYEITRSEELSNSRISTRALYGNWNHRAPFPALPKRDAGPTGTQGTCSVCDGPFADGPARLRWTTSWIGTDPVPLLVRACSKVWSTICPRARTGTCRPRIGRPRPPGAPHDPRHVRAGADPSGRTHISWNSPWKSTSKSPPTRRST